MLHLRDLAKEKAHESITLSPRGRNITQQDKTPGQPRPVSTGRRSNKKTATHSVRKNREAPLNAHALKHIRASKYHLPVGLHTCDTMQRRPEPSTFELLTQICNNNSSARACFRILHVDTSQQCLERDE